MMSQTHSLPDDLATAAASLGRRFPPNFLWGAATAAAQIEGAIDADGRSPSIWDTFARVPGAISGGHTLEHADDHYHRWPQDLEILRDLGVGSYRFSMAWPRIVPASDGVVNAKGLDFYDHLVDELLSSGIDPFLTLYHWDLPQWQQDNGGWADRSTAYRFQEYAAAVAERLGDRVKRWATLNEPWVFTFLGHLHGVHAPGQRSEENAVRGMHHALLAHGLGVQALRAALPDDADIGIALSMTPGESDTTSREDRVATERFEVYRNWLFLHPITHGEYHPVTRSLFRTEIPIEDGDLDIIASPIDHVGINYYARAVLSADDEVVVTGARELQPEGVYTAMGWEVHAQGLSDIISRTHELYAPPAIYVTENGSAWDDEVSAAGDIIDTERVEYLLGHLNEAARCAHGAIPFLGYFAWSLLDNFEWAEGYTKRFGLVHVDYESQTRTLKQSGLTYQAILEAHRASIDEAPA
ncbi:GH1 family beta-glucosidase [Microbacterium sp. NPDC012755]|uniref:GH1 family beta-glucosidase n=1 Tax=Microbacterium sp. NPDC012755 TaxID=3364184 RepID=UPI0036A70AC6